MKVTYKILKDIIENEPTLITDEGEEVVAITCDENGVICESDEGAIDYDYDELDLPNTTLTKRQLINLLESSELNDDEPIVIWNALVNDYMHIYDHIVIQKLYREKYSHIRRSVLYEEYQNNEEVLTLDELDKIDIKSKDIYENYNEYDIPNQFVNEKDFHNWYEEKPQKIGWLQALTRGKKDCDRGGCIEY